MQNSIALPSLVPRPEQVNCKSLTRHLLPSIPVSSGRSHYKDAVLKLYQCHSSVTITHDEVILHFMICTYCTPFKTQLLRNRYFYESIAGTWSSPTVSGTRPPPCAGFSFTMIDGHHAVLFGGYQPGIGRSNDAFILDLTTMVRCMDE